MLIQPSSRESPLTLGTSRRLVRKGFISTFLLGGGRPRRRRRNRDARGRDRGKHLAFRWQRRRAGWGRPFFGRDRARAAYLFVGDPRCRTWRRRCGLRE